MTEINGAPMISVMDKVDMYEANPGDSQLMMDDYPPIAAVLYLRDNDDEHLQAIHCAGVFAGRFSEQFRSGMLGDAIRIDPRLSKGGVLFQQRKYDKCIKKLEKVLRSETDSDVQYIGHLMLSIAYTLSNREDRGFQAMKSLIAAAESKLGSGERTARDVQTIKTRKPLWEWLTSLWGGG